jgi:hypothetical protein
LEELRLEQPGMEEAAEQQIGTQREQGHPLEELMLEQPGMEEAPQQAVREAAKQQIETQQLELRLGQTVMEVAEQQTGGWRHLLVEPRLDQAGMEAEQQTGTQQEQKFLSEELDLQQAVKEAAEQQFGIQQGQKHLLEGLKLEQPGVEAEQQVVTQYE